MFSAALHAYLSGQRLDMQSLARRVGVGRATLYRRAGNREQLLDQVLWWRARRMVAGQLMATAELSGADRIAAVVGGALQVIANDRPLRRFVESDPDTALRILTGGRGQAARGVAAALEHLIDFERDRGCFDADLDSASLAYAIMRISEGFLYADLLADHSPDIERAVSVVRALVAGLDRTGLPGKSQRSL